MLTAGDVQLARLLVQGEEGKVHGAEAGDGDPTAGGDKGEQICIRMLRGKNENIASIAYQTHRMLYNTSPSG